MMMPEPPEKKLKPSAPPSAVDEFPVAASQLCYKSELALFRPPPIRQNCIREAEWVVTDPVAAMREDAHLVDFLLPISTDGPTT